MSTDKNTPPPREWFDAPHDRPADVILAVADLKRLSIWLVGTLIGFGSVVICAAGAYFQSEIREQRDLNTSQGSSISTITQEIRDIKSRWQRLEDAFERNQSGQQSLLVQIAELRAKAASTEEIARSTQQRIEALASYMRENFSIHIRPSSP